eukprot:GHVQ01009295.1.p1 GENE.GHVQ01009295.1~~GHVQ01009295.1.p1  ORF type:complete len:109 (+),score=3.73 GHVQ01009295.1:2090-2416(+)
MAFVSGGSWSADTSSASPSDSILGINGMPSRVSVMLPTKISGVNALTNEATGVLKCRPCAVVACPCCPLAARTAGSAPMCAFGRKCAVPVKSNAISSKVTVDSKNVTR